ncbi:hypothetical protein VPH35_024390 [Triticum aestivum]
MGMTLLPVFALLLLICFYNSDDRLTPEKPLSVSNRLVSNGGIFALGFFSLQNSTANSYVGIWYHNIPERTYVWVANHDNPITGSSSDQSRCLVWMGELVDIEKRGDGLGENLYLWIPSSSVIKKTGALKIALPVMASLLILVCICLVWIRKSRGKDQTKAPMIYVVPEQLGSSDVLYDHNSEFLWISFNEIIPAIDGFSDSNVLGKGGFGIGTLEGGKEVAVKRLTKCSDNGMGHFRNEVVLIAKLQHRNLVRLLGYCIHGAENLLIYEYLPNKSLDYFLFDDAKRFMLDWPTRFSIIKGVARGLVYLHHDSRMTIIHRDLKASNILLDAEMRPKISDFGMARIFGDNQQQENTRHFVGTYYGVLLLEIVSGLKMSSPQHFPNLIDYAWNLLKEGNSKDFLDTVLLNSCSLHQVSLCIHIALSCVQGSPSGKPLMSLVVSMPENEAMPLTMPRQPSYFVGRRHEAEEAREGSVNSAGLTTLLSLSVFFFLSTLRTKCRRRRLLRRFRQLGAGELGKEDGIHVLDGSVLGDFSRGGRG